MILQYPSTGVAVYSITLPNPTGGNTIRRNRRVILHRLYYSYSTYVKDTGTYTLNITISRIRNTLRNTLLTFLENTAGLDIKLTDHNSVAWIGKIVINPMTITADVSDAINTERFNFTIEFVGVKA